MANPRFKIKKINNIKQFEPHVTRNLDLKFGYVSISCLSAPYHQNGESLLNLKNAVDLEILYKNIELKNHVYRQIKQV
jgi:hypothetical protein